MGKGKPIKDRKQEGSLEGNRFLERAMLTAVATRKLRHLRYEQDTGTYEARAQAHVFIVGAPGSGKSTLHAPLSKSIMDDAVFVESITEAGLKGTISKTGKYMPGKITELGGKVLFIDEWDQIRLGEHFGFLSLLENQRFTKSIAYGAEGKIPPIKNPFVHVEVKGNEIIGDAIFSCIACSMKFPTADMLSRQHSTKAVQDALLGRFIVVNIESSSEDGYDLLAGIHHFEIDDLCPPKLESITIAKTAYYEFLAAYRAVGEKKFVEADGPEFITRAFNDVIRMSLPDVLAEYDFPNLSVVVEDEGLLKKNLRWVEPMYFNYYLRGDRKGYVLFSRMWEQDGETETLLSIADRLGCSYIQAKRYKKQYEESHPLLHTIDAVARESPLKPLGRQGAGI